ncbi:hypothetical protein IV54_GL000525 [Levilactobacillus paucivorans]|uniref:Uncharacterized protein n=1 Tax=Levilactobacillus paucivorans TaxID=616990 RepID=A0A0R2LH79_9LACO|nr:hypothetical protein [Levilactobacillus paucivorans]KRO01167.1 hypothetical protein IV54_GL000525 [Levilactobacillus paucivorans]
MKRAVFLVTDCHDLKQATFASRLSGALRTAERVDLLVATPAMETVWEIRAELNRLATRDSLVAQANLVTLADVFAKDAGRVLSAKERLAVDLSECEERVFVDHSQQVKRYLRAGQLVAELRQLDDETPMVLRQYDYDQLVQTVTYGLNGAVVAVARIQAGVAQTRYLLNQQGEAVLRLTRQVRTGQHVLSLQPMSGMAAALPPDEHVALENAFAQRQASVTAADQTVLLPATDVTYSGVVYANYQRLTTTEDLYRVVLNRVLTPDFQLFSPLAINDRLSPLLPNQLIFNY